ncbi:MAG: sulfurtransferase complex subunit TusC [Methylomonas sp.]|jgi:tRNA 2-thiouridine synthesizing protein C
MKKYLFVMRSPPNTGASVQETLDMILTTAAFDQETALLFADDGVLQLKRGQNPSALGLYDAPAVLSALEIYDVKTLYAEQESLRDRGLNSGDLILPVEPIERDQIGALLRCYDVVISD